MRYFYFVCWFTRFAGFNVKQFCWWPMFQGRSVGIISGIRVRAIVAIYVLSKRVNVKNEPKISFGIDDMCKLWRPFVLRSPHKTLSQKLGDKIKWPICRTSFYSFDGLRKSVLFLWMLSYE